MPTVHFGKKHESPATFEQAPDLIAVRTHSRRSLRGGVVVGLAAAEVADGELVLAFPDAGVEVFRVPVDAGRRSLAARKVALTADPDVRFAGGVLTDPASGEPVLYTENLFIKFADDAEPEECARVLADYGLTVKEKVGYAPNAYFVAAPEGTGQRVFDTAEELLTRDDVEYCHPEVVRERRARAIAPQQWHLRTTSIGGVTIAASANVEAAHQVTRGEGVIVAVIDDGVDVDHPELAVPGKIVAPRDASWQSDDPRPKGARDNHGTACAGVACAAGLAGASGVAPAARLLPIRSAESLGSVRESQAFQWAADHGADVISCSWGPPDGDWSDPDDPRHQRVVPLPASSRLALEYVTTRGRGGRGCVVLFAAGNGNESVDHDGYASCPLVIAVAACNDRSTRSVYSDFGNAIWCAFPSNDLAHPPAHPAPLTPGIWTTDRSGLPGYNPGDPFARGDAAGNYCRDFGGTSSACPGAAGVAALVLAVNPQLRWQEVRDVLRRACEPIDPANGQYDADGRSPLYGYGRLDAAAAVAAAQMPPSPRVRIERVLDEPILDHARVTVALDVGEARPLRSVAVAIDLEHTYIGDLEVTLTPPPATGVAPIVLHARTGGATHDLRMTYDAATTPALATLAGLSGAGTWTLAVADRAAIDEGRLRLVRLELGL